MKVASSADWRQSILFETPMLVADVVVGEATRCFTCGIESEPRPRTELWAFKHRHPRHHDGFVRFYCQEHVPAVVRPEPVIAAPAPKRRRGPSPSRAAAPAADPKPRAMCPECFVEVSATGVCGMCGTRVA